jgi:predicted phage-related endonuclease
MSDQPWRQDALGASDAPALVGVDHWRTAGDVWAEKTGRLPAGEDPSTRGSLDVRALGSAIEPMLLDVATHRLGLRDVSRQVWYQHPEHPLACSVDGLDVATPKFPGGVLLEAKTVGLLGWSPTIDEYGEPGTDEVPEAVNVQVHHCFAVLDAQPHLQPVRLAFVVALLGGRGVQLYRIERDDQLVTELLAHEVEWWNDHVLTDRCPPAELPSLQTLKRLRRQPDAPAVPVDPDTVQLWLDTKAARKNAEKAEEEAHRLVLMALGDSEQGRCSLGTLTYRATHRAAYEVPAQTVRTLRFKAAAEGRRVA